MDKVCRGVQLFSPLFRFWVSQYPHALVASRTKLRCIYPSQLSGFSNSEAPCSRGQTAPRVQTTNRSIKRCTNGFFNENQVKNRVYCRKPPAKGFYSHPMSLGYVLNWNPYFSAFSALSAFSAFSAFSAGSKMAILDTFQTLRW